jgi:hypothetical protein
LFGLPIPDSTAIPDAFDVVGNLSTTLVLPQENIDECGYIAPHLSHLREDILLLEDFFVIVLSEGTEQSLDTELLHPRGKGQPVNSWLGGMFQSGPQSLRKPSLSISDSQKGRVPCLMRPPLVLWSAFGRPNQPLRHRRFVNAAPADTSPTM